MGMISLVIPQIGQPDTTEDVKLQNALTTIQTVINGNLDSTNLTAAISQSAGINASGQTVKGTVSIPTTQSTSSTTYTTLATPDQVTGLVVPNNGIIQVRYFAYWTESVANAARAAIFVGVNEISAEVAGSSAPSPVQTEATLGNASLPVRPLVSTPSGLISDNSASSSSGPVTTGQTLSEGTGGACEIFGLPAGTYTISVQFKVASGNVTVRNRRLWATVLSFA